MGKLEDNEARRINDAREVIDTDMYSPLIRTVWIHLENDKIGDDFFTLEVAKTLRLYADMLESGKAGNTEVDKFVSPGDTRLFSIGVAWTHRLAQVGGDRELLDIGEVLNEH